MRRLLVHVFILLPTCCLQSQPPVLEKIALYGNTRTKNNIILREFDLRAGKPLSDALLRRDRAWLLRLDFLKRIEFQTKPGSTQDRRLLIVVVQEKNPWSISPILSNNDLFGWYTGTHLTYRSLQGRRNRIDATLQVGGIHKIALSWFEPWFGGKQRLFAGLDIYYTAFRYRYGDHSPHFDQEKTAAILTLGKGIGRKWRLGIRTGIQHVWVDDPGVTFSQTHTDNLSLLESFGTFDSRDWPPYPKTGLYLRAWHRWFGPFQTHRFQYTGMEIRYYNPIYHENILALQTSVEISRGTIPVYKRIHLGGGQTIRGYSTGSLAGENGFFATLEYRFPIFYERNPLAGINVGYAGVLFVDTGAAWSHGQTLKTNMLRSSFGLGIHVIWDRWVLRAEYGNHGKGWGFVTAGTGVKF